MLITSAGEIMFTSVLVNFLSRLIMPMHAQRDIVLPIPCVRPSVRLSNAGTVSKRMDMSSHFLDGLIWASL